jgi:hypothetical protein
LETLKTQSKGWTVWNERTRLQKQTAKLDETKPDDTELERSNEKATMEL